MSCDMAPHGILHRSTKRNEKDDQAAKEYGGHLWRDRRQCHQYGPPGQLELDSIISVPLLDSAFVESDQEGDPFRARARLLEFHGTFTVASSRKLVRILRNDIREHGRVIFDMANLTHIDDNTGHLIALLIDCPRQSGTEIIFTGIPEKVREVFHAFNVLHHVPAERVVHTRDETRELAMRILN